MAHCLFFISVLLLAFTSSQIVNHSKQWEKEFDHYTFLTGDETYRLYWTVDREDETVDIGLEVESTGWIGFGISDNGLMSFADIILGWIDHDGNPYLQRRHTESSRTTIYDEDIINDLSFYEQNDTITRMRFKRDLFPCADSDNPYRKQIVVGTTQVIWAFDPNNPIIDDDNPNGDPSYHTSRGKQTINFLSGKSTEIQMSNNTQSFDFLMDNYTVTPRDTVYHCKFIEIPNEISEPSHMIRFDPVIQEGNEATVHHMLLYWCQDFNVSFVGFEGDCNEFANMPFDGSECKSDLTLAGWGIGGTDFYYPEHVGLPLDGKIYAMLQIHYDNPELRDDITDSSGIRIYWTDELRQYSASSFVVGASFDQIWIPGDIDQPITQSFYSHPQCTENSDMSEDGVYAFAGMLHAHTIGVAMKLRHIRDNVEMKPLLQNDAYDFNYQQWTTFSEEVIIYPGDEFVCECVYDLSADTSNNGRKYPTYGGQSTKDEMCACTLLLYPETTVDFAGTTFTDSQYADFWNKATANGWWNGTESWSENEANKNVFYYNGTAEGALQHFIEFMETEQRLSICDGYFDEMMTIPEAREDFQPLPDDDWGNCNVPKDDESWFTTQRIYFIAIGCGVLLVIVIAILMYRSHRNKNNVSRPYEPMDETEIENTQYGATAD